MSRMRSIPTKQAAAQTLVLTRTFNAPRDLVFKAWTQPQQVMRWWGPKGFTTPICRIELRLGGVFRTCMRSPDGKDFWSQGAYHEIDEPNRIVFSDAFADDQGNTVSPRRYGMSDDWPTETIVTVSFSEHAGKTRLTLQHWPLKPGAERDMCQQGWNESLDKLAEHLVGLTVRRTEQGTMRAVALDRFGGPEVMTVQTLPIAEVGPDEILIRVESAGVGVWDPFEREGGFAKAFGIEPRFPYVLGSDAAGTVAGVGDRVDRFKEGDRVYAFTIMNPKGGSYAEYVVVDGSQASHIPGGLTTEQAGVMPVDAMTALRGLDDTLDLKPGESLMIFGAGGGIGHLALQLAKRMGARVLAVASGEDGVALAERLGADAVVDGRTDDVVAAAREFAPEGLDAALLTAGGDAAENALTALREGGRVAYPNGVEPEPEPRPGLTIRSYDGTPDPQAIEKLNRLIESGPFAVHVAQTFSLEQAAEAHRAVQRHHLGKLALRPM